MTAIATRHAFQVTTSATDAAGGLEVRLDGRVSSLDAGRLWQELVDALPMDGTNVTFDLSGLRTLDGAAAAVLQALCGRVRVAGGTSRYVGSRAEIERVLSLYGCPTAASAPKEAPRGEGLLEHLGRATFDFFRELRETLSFIGELFVYLGRAIRAPRSVNWRDVPILMERAGANGMPIVLIVNFLVGAIMALQAAPQLERFGANIFVVDLVGLSIVRELGPLMTAILVAGRSGAAFAAELGTMKVSEEIDALRVMGFDPQRYLVLPRIIALFVVVPFMTLFADVIGIFGGWVVGVWSLDLTSTVFLSELSRAVVWTDVASGLLKSAFFAIVIAWISCQRGLATSGGATGVGSATTSAVVSILFALVVLDAIFTFVFSMVGW